MKRPRRREIEIFSLSFLDVVSCGFGAMIVLLVVVIATQKQAVEQVSSDLRGQVSASTTTRETLADENQALVRELEARKRQLAQLQQRLTVLAASSSARSACRARRRPAPRPACGSKSSCAPCSRA